MVSKREIILNNKINSLLFRFSAPAIMGMIVGALYNIVDAIFVGKGAGPMAIAALSIVFPVQLIMMAVGIMIGIGGASIISRALGRKEKELAANTFGNGIILNITFSIIFLSLCYVFMDQLLIFFGASARVMPYARSYMEIVLFGMLFFSFAVSANNLIRAEGSPKSAMLVMVIGALSNIILDPIFIFAMDLGIRGAAIATVISQFFSAVYVFGYYLAGKGFFKLKLSIFRINLNIMKETISVGFPSFLRASASSVILLMFNRILGYYGNDLYIAIIGIGLRMVSLIQMPIVGITQGFSTIAGFNYGAKLIPRVKKVLGAALVWSGVIAFSGFIAVMFFTREILGLFSNSPLLVNMGILPLRTVVIFLPFIGLQIIGGGLFQAIGKPVPALVITVSRQLLFLIPALIGLPVLLGLTGVWIAIPVADFLSIIVTALWLYREINIFNKQIIMDNKLKFQEG
ncbi:MAG: MATE family efflux transporter [Candidatus Humimicrobiaceae bacterium]